MTTSPYIYYDYILILQIVYPEVLISINQPSMNTCPLWQAQNMVDKVSSGVIA